MYHFLIKAIMSSVISKGTVFEITLECKLRFALYWNLHSDTLFPDE